MPCQCPPDDENPVTNQNQMRPSIIYGVPLMVSPENNQFRARGYSLCYDDVFRVIAETRRDGFPVMGK